jgi:hypothetical protein
MRHQFLIPIVEEWREKTCSGFRLRFRIARRTLAAARTWDSACAANTLLCRLRSHPRTVVDVGCDRGRHTGHQRTYHILVLETPPARDDVQALRRRR